MSFPSVTPMRRLQLTSATISSTWLFQASIVVFLISSAVSGASASMRDIIHDAPDNPDNRGYIVTRVALDNEERWEEFRELDLED